MPNSLPLEIFVERQLAVFERKRSFLLNICTECNHCDSLQNCTMLKWPIKYCSKDVTLWYKKSFLIILQKLIIMKHKNSYREFWCEGSVFSPQSNKVIPSKFFTAKILLKCCLTKQYFTRNSKGYINKISP